jgi:hypothetical protein
MLATAGRAVIAMTENSITLSTVETIALDDRAHDITLLRIVEDEIGRLTSLRNTLRGNVKDRLDDREFGTVNGVPVVRWSNELRVTISPKLLRARHPEVARECEEIAPVRKFWLLDAA